MKNSPLISIVVPVYKTEKFLRACVESILAQTFTDFELVLVDDGSPDNCPKICDEFAGTDSRVKVVHQENRGLSQARVSGIKNSAGTWIMFIDSDDMIPAGTLEILAKNIRDDVDIVTGKQTRIDENDFSPKTENHVPAMPIFRSREEYLYQFFCGNEETGTFVAKIFRKTLLPPQVFEIPRKLVWGEDLIGVVRAAGTGLRKVCIVDAVCYFYRFNFQSISFLPKLYAPELTLGFVNEIKKSLETALGDEQKRVPAMCAALAMNLFYNRTKILGQKIDWETWQKLLKPFPQPNTRQRAILRSFRWKTFLPFYLSLFLRSPKKLREFLKKQRESTVVQ